MRQAAALLRERADEIAALLTQEQGKPLAEARVEVLAGVGIIEWLPMRPCACTAASCPRAGAMCSSW